MHRYIIQFLILGLLSCNQAPMQSNLNQDTLLNTTQVDTLIQKDNLPIATDIKLITNAIDSIYKIKSAKLTKVKFNKNSKFIKDLTIISTDNSAYYDSLEDNLTIAHPLFVFDLENTNSLYEYGQFSFLYFNNNESAKTTFINILKLFKENKLTELKGVNYFYDVFDKGGAWFMRKDNLIIHKYRSCSDSSTENDNEDKLIHYLYNGNEINEKGYFMRYCCSCRQNLQEIYR